jgi:myo-inositol-hexaphosphate 3-phosphohydrolase
MKNTSNRKFNNVLFFILNKLCIPVILFLIVGGVLYAQTSVTSVLSLNAAGISDQDDMCIWIHPTDKSKSTIIASDKGANKLFVYDLNGNALQTIDVPGMPGNIDLRYNFDISGEPTDIVGYNDRSNSTLVFYKVDQSTRELSFISNFAAGSNYGFCLYRSFITGKYYAFSSNKSSRVRQFELSGATGTITGLQVREWYNGSGNTEGLVADDELAKFYAANESDGVNKYDAEPDDLNPTGELIAPTGVNGFSADVEGITIYYAANEEGYLIASSQGNSRFYVFNRIPPHNYVNYFTVDGVGSTDGIDITNVSLDSTFQAGIFFCHDGTGSPYVIRISRYEDIGLLIDTTYWDPRNSLGATSIINSLTNPSRFFLTQNYPNPFNPVTIINYFIPEKTNVSPKIFNSMGELVSDLVNEEKEPGNYSVDFDASGLASGIYVYRLQTTSFSANKKMMLIR